LNKSSILHFQTDIHKVYFKFYNNWYQSLVRGLLRCECEWKEREWKECGVWETVWVHKQRKEGCLGQRNLFNLPSRNLMVIMSFGPWPWKISYLARRCGRLLKMGYLYSVPATEAQWKVVTEATLKDLKVKKYLFQATDREILETILDTSTSKMIWQSMQQKYQGSTRVKWA